MNIPNDALRAAFRVINTDEMGGAFDNQEEYVAAILQAAAPFLGREAKVTALKEAAAAYPGGTQDMVSRDSVTSWLLERATTQGLEPTM